MPDSALTERHNEAINLAAVAELLARALMEQPMPFGGPDLGAAADHLARQLARHRDYLQSEVGRLRGSPA